MAWWATQQQWILQSSEVMDRGVYQLQEADPTWSMSVNNSIEHAEHTTASERHSILVWGSLLKQTHCWQQVANWLGIIQSKSSKSNRGGRRMIFNVLGFYQTKSLLEFNPKFWLQLAAEVVDAMQTSLWCFACGTSGFTSHSGDRPPSFRVHWLPTARGSAGLSFRNPRLWPRHLSGYF